jgi:hypothetical protein
MDLHLDRDWAVFLPAVSAVYVRYASRRTWPRRQLRDVQPRDLNFLDPNNRYFFYPFVLYSAGYADLNDPDRESMITRRVRGKTWVLGDSGGYQAATGVLDFPWAPLRGENPTTYRQRQDLFRGRILHWLETQCDWGMNLDFPTLAVGNERARKNGLVSFEACLEGSLKNFKYFAKNRRNKCNLFNVLQGMTAKERDSWWEAVKHYPFDGFAWSIATSSNLYALLDRIVKMIRQGDWLERSPQLHMLGNGKLTAALAYTALQRALRRHVNPKISITYDVSSPMSTAGRHRAIYTGIYLDGLQRVPSPSGNTWGRLGFRSSDLFTIRKSSVLKPSDPLDWSYTVECRDLVESHPSPLCRNLLISDIWVDQDKIDPVSYMLLMWHNTYVYCRGMLDANRLFDDIPASELDQYFPDKLIRFAKPYREYEGGYVEAIIANARNGRVSDELLQYYRRDLETMFGTEWAERYEFEVWPPDIPIEDPPKEEYTIADIFS